MSLDIFFKEDTRNALLAANEGCEAPVAVIADCISRAGYQVGMMTAVMKAYRWGYKAALTTVALAFGLSPAIIGGVHGQDAAKEREILREISNQHDRLELE